MKLFSNFQTPADHRDAALIKKTVDIVEDIIQEVDKQTGQSKCTLTKGKLEYIDEKQKSHLIDESEVVLCDGVLKNNRGTVSVMKNSYIFKKF